MASTRVFSWKINGDKYGYLYVPGKRNLITNRITEDSILTDIATEVSKWSLQKYTSAFNELNSQINQLYGVSIQGNVSDFYGGNVNNYIILTGEDGTSYGPEKPMLSTEEMQKITDTISSNIQVSTNYLTNIVDNYKAETDSKIDSFSGILKTELEEATIVLSAQTVEMMQVFSGAIDTFSAATEIFNLSSQNITADKIAETIQKTDDSTEWIEANSGTVANINSNISRLEGEITNNSLAIQSIESDMTSFSGIVSASIGQINSEIAEIQREIPSTTASTTSTTPSNKGVYRTNMYEEPNSTRYEKSELYNDLIEMIFEEFQRKPVVIWEETTPANYLKAIQEDLGANPSWQLTNLDMTPYKRIKIYTCAGRKSSGVGIEASTTPATVLEMILDSRAAISDYGGNYCSSIEFQKPNDANRFATLTCAVSADKTKFVVLRQTNIYGTEATANDDANANVFMIEGYYD